MEEDKRLRIVRYHRIAFVSADSAWSILKISSGGVSAPISKVMCLSYVFLARSFSRALN